ncbi:hypothetical protein BaRGS_00007313, partial [Batillaria attramentaria]
ASAGDKIVGKFHVSETSPIQTLDCDGSSSGVTHKKGFSRSSLTVTWTAPKPSRGNVRFRATFVESFDKYWIGVESAELVSAKVEAKKLTKSVVSDKTDDKKNDPEFVLSLENNEVQSTAPKQKEKEYVIPLIKQNKWRSEAEKRLVSVKAEADQDDLDIQAAKEVLEDSSRYNESWDDRGKPDPNLAIPLLMQNKVPEGFETDDKLDVALRPDEPDDADYEQIPIEHFGFAMLRGMGWKEGQGIGKDCKVIAPIEATLRPKGLGLGADRSQSSGGKKGTSVEKDAGGEEDGLEVKKGAYCVILNGKHKDLYGVIQGIDEDNARLVIKLTVSGQTVTMTQYNVKIVGKKEYEKYSKYLNKGKADQYKESASEQNGKEEHSDGSYRERRNKNFKKGKYYKEKVVVLDVISRDSAVCRTDDGKVLEGLSHTQLETVIPKGRPLAGHVTSKSTTGNMAEAAETTRKDGDGSRDEDAKVSATASRQDLEPAAEATIRSQATSSTSEFGHPQKNGSSPLIHPPKLTNYVTGSTGGMCMRRKHFSNKMAEDACGKKRKDSKQPTKSGSQTFLERYNLYKGDFPFIDKSAFSERHAFCLVCRQDIKIEHSGRGDILAHAGRQHFGISEYLVAIAHMECHQQLRTDVVSTGGADSQTRPECIIAPSRLNPLPAKSSDSECDSGDVGKELSGQEPVVPSSASAEAGEVSSTSEPQGETSDSALSGATASGETEKFAAELSKNNQLKDSVTTSVITSSQAGFVFGENLSQRVTGVTEGAESHSGAAEAAPTSASSSQPLVFGENLSGRVSLSNGTGTGQTDSHDENGDNEAQAAGQSGGRSGQTLEESAREYQAKHDNKVDLKEVQVITGEEDESNVLQANGKLFVFDCDTQTWVERGRGTVRLNDMSPRHPQNSHTFQSRLVMRTQGSLRVILNTKIWPGMNVERASTKAIRITATDTDQAVRVFLIVTNPKDSENLLRAIDWRVQQLKIHEEHDKPAESDRHGEKRKADAESESPVMYKQKRFEGACGMLRKEESDSSVQDPETEAKHVRLYCGRMSETFVEVTGAVRVVLSACVLADLHMKRLSMMGQHFRAVSAGWMAPCFLYQDVTARLLTP